MSKMRDGVERAAGNPPLPVLIVGGGPVGLALAAELGWRGVRCLLVEQGDGAVVEAKMFATGIRTMEFCRRWGIAERVRNWGFPADFPFDNVFVTSLTGHELARIPIPSLGETRPPPVSPEHPMHCPQFVFDPLLADFVGSLPSVTLRYRCRLEGLQRDDDGVSAELVDERTGDRQPIRARYLVGCDGYTSTVRRLLGIEMRGRPVVNRSINIMFRTPNLAALHDKGNAGRYILIGPEGTWATFVAADGTERWRLTIYGSEEFDVASLDAGDIIRRAVGRDFDFEVLTVGNWTRRMLVADRYGDGRVFLAGDAVHVMPPNGGFGMNTGIGDAVDLGWKLAAVHDGWADPNLLDSYEIERRPVGVRACDEALRNFDRLTSSTRYPNILDDTAEGAGTRAALGARLAAANRLAWEDPLDVHLGYRYEASPICVPDGPPMPPGAPHDYVPTSRPGARAPHAWLGDGRSTLDLFGRGFTLLRFGSDAPAADTLAAAAARRNVPLSVVTITAAEAAAVYARRLVLVRPDGHVAWRGDAAPAAVEGARSVEIVRGAG
jgi:2-polyprenyl-6-methoxyphenol hydroxylase-like FAD-dependent oxidoreductase